MTEQPSLKTRPHRFSAERIPALKVTVRRSDIFNQLHKDQLSSELSKIESEVNYPGTSKIHPAPDSDSGLDSISSDPSAVDQPAGLSKVSPVFDAEIIDFSTKGLKLALPFSAQFEEILVVRLEFSDINYSYQGQANVRHIREESDVWIAGCSIEPHLPAPIIDHLANVAGKERRRDPRSPVFGEGWVRTPGDVDGTPAIVQNISLGGFCLQVQQEMAVGERIQFLAYNKKGKLETYSVRVRWQSDNNDGTWRMGCSFEESYAYDRLQWCLAFNEPRTILERVDSIKWYVIAASLLAMLAPPAIPLAINAIQAAGSHESTVVANHNQTTDQASLIGARVDQANTDNATVSANPKSLDIETPPEITIETPRTSSDPRARITEVPFTGDESDLENFNDWKNSRRPNGSTWNPGSEVADLNTDESKLQRLDRARDTEFAPLEEMADKSNGNNDNIGSTATTPSIVSAVDALNANAPTETSDREIDLDHGSPNNDSQNPYLIQSQARSTNSNSPWASVSISRPRWTNENHTRKRELEFMTSTARTSRRNTSDKVIDVKSDRGYPNVPSQLVK